MSFASAVDIRTTRLHASPGVADLQPLAFPSHQAALPALNTYPVSPLFSSLFHIIRRGTAFEKYFRVSYGFQVSSTFSGDRYEKNHRTFICIRAGLGFRGVSFCRRPNETG